MEDLLRGKSIVREKEFARAGDENCDRARGIFSRACHGAVPRVTRCRPVFFFRSRGVVVGEALGAHAPGSPSEAFLPLSMVSART